MARFTIIESFLINLMGIFERLIIYGPSLKQKREIFIKFHFTNLILARKTRFRANQKSFDKRFFRLQISFYCNLVLQSLNGIQIVRNKFSIIFQSMSGRCGCVRLIKINFNISCQYFLLFFHSVCI